MSASSEAVPGVAQAPAGAHHRLAPWEQPLPQEPKLREQVEELKENKLLLDIREPGYMDDLVMRPAYSASPRLWLAFLLSGLGLMVFGAVWLTQMVGGIG